MNSQKSKKQKCSTFHDNFTLKNNKVENQKNDVIVLPPDLLQKLGINLGNFQPPQNCLLETNKGTSTNAFVDKDTKELSTEKKNNESSILETANLMKASVFLSPTFNELKPNTILDTEIYKPIVEAAPVHKNKINDNVKLIGTSLKADSMHCNNLQISNNEDKICDALSSSSSNKDEKITTVLETISPKHVLEFENKLNIEEIPEHKSSKDLESLCKNAMIPEKVETVISTNNNILKPKDTILSNIPYKSPDKSNVTKHLNKKRSMSKEEQQNKNFQGEKDSFVSVDDSRQSIFTLNNNITSEVSERGKRSDMSTELHECLDLNVQDKNSQDNVVASLESRFDVVNETHLNKNNQEDTSINYHNETYNVKPTVCESHSQLIKDKTEFTLNLVPINDADNISPEIKTKEITTNQHSDIDQYRHDSMSKNVNTGQSKGNSKLCTQGVEKPGGIVKTYCKNKKLKLSNKINEPICYPENNADIDYKITDTNGCTFTKNLYNICLCNDFGKFIPYDCINSYEHIHFWERKKVQCSIETLLSIFQDSNFEDASKENKVYNEADIEYEWENSDNTTMDTICWNNISNIGESENIESHSKCNQEFRNVNQEYLLERGHQDYLNDDLKKFEPNTNTNNSSKVVILENKEVKYDKSNIANLFVSNGKQIRMCNINFASNKNSVSNKRKLDHTSDSESDSEKSSVKKMAGNIKCGVCNGKMLKTEWNNHIARDHCFIAWKEGQEIDLMNEDLLTKLKDRLYDTNKLICTFCESELYEVDKFIDHVQKCKQKTHAEENSDVDKSKVIIEVPPVHMEFEDQQAPAVPISNVECKKIQMVEISVEVGNEFVEEVPVSHVQSKKNYNMKLPKSQKIKVRKFGEVSMLQTKTVEVRKAEKPMLEFEIVEKQIKSPETVVKEHVVEQCVVNTEIEEKQIAKESVLPKENVDKQVTCGVCRKLINDSLWMDHLSHEHDYIAWKDDELPLDLTDEDVIRDYLNNLIKEIGELVCKHCGLKRKFAKSYLKHMKTCEGMLQELNAEVVEDVSKQIVVKTETIMTGDMDIRCGVCQVELTNDQWIDHIFKEHDYLAWKEGEPMIDANDSQQVYNYLFDLSKQLDGLTCLKCGRRRKYVRNYLKHLEECSGEADSTLNVSLNDSVKHQDSNKTVGTAMQKLSCEEHSNVTCGVCKMDVDGKLWLDHIQKEHTYLAWKDGEVPLDLNDSQQVYDYLFSLSKRIAGLICSKCGRRRKYVRNYLKHVETCNGATDSRTQNDTLNESVNDGNDTLDAPVQDLSDDELGNVICGVCKTELEGKQWLDHIQKEHAYMAWKEGKPPVDVNDSQQVYDHLSYLTKKNDGLICMKCGCRRRYVRTYLKHFESCNGETDSVQNNTLNNSVKDSDNTVDAAIQDLSDDEDGNVTCGVCKMEVDGKQWLQHIQKQHAYLAWKEGKPPLNLDDDEEVYNYLYLVSKKYNGLICNKCGLNRKYIKVYLAHIESCDSDFLSTSMVTSGVSDKDSYVCGVCAEEVDARDWKSHAMKKHYNIAWVVGDYPLDLKNPSIIENCLKEYRKVYGTLKCKLCDITRISIMGFYAHIIQCGKTEEEIDNFRLFCEICNNKYLCIYKYQHIAMHRAQENTRERKMLEAQAREAIETIETEPVVSDRRRAAQKALKYIEKAEKFEYNCDSCGYGADDELELQEHVCSKTKYKDYSGTEGSSEDSLESSGEESVDSIPIESNLSEEEEVKAEPRRRKHGESGSAASRVPRIPFNVRCPKSYLRQSAENYRDNFLTNGTLYPQWRSCNIGLVPEDQVDKYLPTRKESCKVIIGKSDATTLKQFEVKKNNGYSVFVGGCIQSISWAPPHLDDDNDEFGHFLAVACHNSDDSPRLDCTKTYEYPGMIQIWDFGDLTDKPPEFLLGIAHDYGTIWAIDWCPSGARDVWFRKGTLSSLPESFSSDTYTFLRLGLLAIACSNGSAYIFSVPYPSLVKTSGKVVYKLTPVAELRLSRGERDLYQATSISWSPQKDHATVMVGYSDGTIALYNLECDSPLLMVREGDVNIFYPFQEERPHNSCIEDVKMFPSAVGGGLISSVSPTGSETAQQRGVARIHGHLSSTSSAFAPHWPSLMLSGNEAIVNQSVNELDWWGVGRRTGGVQRGCGCAHCGHMAMYTPPLLRLMTTHPAYLDLNKEPVALIQMKPLGQKRTKQKTDELQLKLEPLSYQDAVKMYALELKLVSDKVDMEQFYRTYEQYPERYPLNDVPSMAFNPSPRHHRKLALATHAGIIFMVTV